MDQQGFGSMGRIAQGGRRGIGKGQSARGCRTRLKILKDGRDKLVNLADTMHEEAEDKTHEELIKLNEEILYNKGNIQNMAQMLLISDDPDILIQDWMRPMRL
jgi:hypothetical protein